MDQAGVDSFLSALAAYGYTPARKAITNTSIILIGRLEPNTKLVQRQWDVMWEFVDLQLIQRKRPYRSTTYKLFFTPETKLQRVFMWGVELHAVAGGDVPIAEVVPLMMGAPRVSKPPIEEVALVGGRSARGMSGEMGKVPVGPMAQMRARSF